MCIRDSIQTVPSAVPDDAGLIRAFGRGVCEIIIRSGDSPPGERHRRVEEEVRELVKSGNLNAPTEKAEQTEDD